MMIEKQIKRVSVVVSGRVQGVGFRFFAKDIADSNAITGWVRNTDNRTVELEAQGNIASIESFCDTLKEGPQLSDVREIIVTEIPPISQESAFCIRYYECSFMVLGFKNCINRPDRCQ
jgi:acylphosphatase